LGIALIAKHKVAGRSTAVPAEVGFEQQPAIGPETGDDLTRDLNQALAATEPS
jgi:hypothetical protein